MKSTYQSSLNTNKVIPQTQIKKAQFQLRLCLQQPEEISIEIEVNDMGSFMTGLKLAYKCTNQRQICRNYGCDS